MEHSIVDAIDQQNLEFFETLRKNHYDFTQDSSSVLCRAAQLGKSRVIALIAPWSEAAVHNNEPLVLAARLGHKECVKLLIPYSTSVERAILTASVFGQYTCVDILSSHASFTAENSGVVVNRLLSANMLDAVEHLLPLMDVHEVYLRLEPDHLDLFEQVRARWEHKVLTRVVGDFSTARKALKI